MSLRARPVVTASSSDDEDEIEVQDDAPKPPPPPPQPTLSQWAITQTLASTAQLSNLLPTGTLLALQTVTPIFTNHGSCDAVTRPLTAILLIFLLVACFLASFTDSFKSADGQIFYGFATFKGMWLFDSQAAAAPGLPDLRKYKLTAVDWIHAFVSAFVLATLAMRDRSVVSCFYPRPSHEAQEVLDIVPLGLGLVCSLVFVIFPSKRHGIGYPVSH
uniref:Protein DMP3-like n=1 Tax=Tanacetum cinerariifolium TaxID=118510 RepID=A0A699I976_TANCI|nr:protein DMP3-like [Tanacetum cinerariifolium]